MSAVYNPMFWLGTAYKHRLASDGNTFVIKLCDKVLQYASSTIFFITRYIASTCNLQPEEVQL